MRDRMIQVNGSEIAILSKEGLARLLQPAPMQNTMRA
jgi:hypothetical protein